MTRIRKTAAFSFVALLGLWGCAKAPVASNGGGGTDDTLKARVQKLEDEGRAAAAARDSFRQKLVAAEEATAKLKQDLAKAKAEAAKERDSLTAELKSRTTERDQMSNQYEGFRKQLREILGQAEASLTTPPAPALEGTSALSVPVAPFPSVPAVQ